VRRAIATAAVSALLWGCSPDSGTVSVSEYEAQRQAAVARLAKSKGAAPQTKAAPGEAAPGQPTENAFGGGANKGFTYVAAGKRDPFRSFILEQQASRNLKHDRGPLEQFELAQLALHAVVWDTPRPRALVTDPSGRGYIVAEGTPIGKNEGRVTKITDNLVVVRETYVDYLGERTEKDIEMRVRQKSQGG
jgi:type IV pilus assembly protein PilP